MNKYGGGRGVGPSTTNQLTDYLGTATALNQSVSKPSAGVVVVWIKRYLLGWRQADNTGSWFAPFIHHRCWMVWQENCDYSRKDTHRRRRTLPCVSAAAPRTQIRVFVQQNELPIRWRFALSASIPTRVLWEFSRKTHSTPSINPWWIFQHEQHTTVMIINFLSKCLLPSSTSNSTSALTTDLQNCNYLLMNHTIFLFSLSDSVFVFCHYEKRGSSWRKSRTTTPNEAQNW